MFVVDFLLRDGNILKNCKIYNNLKVDQPLTDKDDINNKLSNNKYDYITVQNNSLHATLYEHKIMNYWIHDINTNISHLIDEYINSIAI